MLKHLLNGGSLLSYALYDKENDERAALRAQIAKDTNVTARSEHEPKDKEEDNGQDVDSGADNEGDDEGGNKEEKDEDEGEERDDKEKIEETAEEKEKREASEKEAAKAQRKQDRMQRRIDEAISAKKAAEDKVAALEAQLAADPDKTLTAEEIKKQAKALADEQIKAKELETLQANFQKSCDDLQAAAKKIDKEFDDKIEDVCAQFGPIPSFMIGVLADMDNGGEVLAYLADKEDEAEGVWKKSPATMTRKLVEISNKLIEAKKKPKKQLSNVPDPVEPVNGSRQVSSAITEADAKDMEVWTAKRRQQMIERRKAQGYG